MANGVVSPRLGAFGLAFGAVEGAASNVSFFYKTHRVIVFYVFFFSSVSFLSA